MNGAEISTNTEGSKKVIEFTVELAGVPVLMRSCSEINKERMRKYLTDKAPLAVVEPTDEDIETLKKAFDRQSKKYNFPAEKYGRESLEYFLMHLQVADKLLPFNVLLLHGSAICMDGEVYIFIAPSGTGKSTHTRLWREQFGDRCYMINDDKPLIRFEGDDIRVYGTPWAGKHNLERNTSAPLKAIIQLRRGSENHIERFPKDKAYYSIMKQGYHSPRKDEKIKTLRLQKILVETVDFYELTCNMEPDAAWTAWKGMNQSDNV